MASGDEAIHIAAGASPANAAARRAADLPATRSSATSDAGAASAATTRNVAVSTSLRPPPTRSTNQWARVAPGGWPLTWVGYDGSRSTKVDRKSRGRVDAPAPSAGRRGGCRAPCRASPTPRTTAAAAGHSSAQQPRADQHPAPAQTSRPRAPTTPPAAPPARRAHHSAGVHSTRHVPTNGGALQEDLDAVPSRRLAPPQPPARTRRRRRPPRSTRRARWRHTVVDPAVRCPDPRRRSSPLGPSGSTEERHAVLGGRRNGSEANATSPSAGRDPGPEPDALARRVPGRP